MTHSPLVDAAVTDAHRAFETARRLPMRNRARWLEAIADRLQDAAGELIDVAAQETHLPLGRLRGELTRTIFQARLLATEVEMGEFVDATIDHADAEWGMGPRPDLRRMNVPLGVVAVFGASNFPFAFSVAGGDTVAALAAGCAVVHKGHSDHRRLAERTGELVVGALRDAGAPNGLFSVVIGQELGGALVEHPLVQAVGFTGSTAGGRALFDLAVGRPVPIPFYGELGSTNPVFVTSAAWAARRDEILAGYAGSASLGMGQFCTKPGFLIVPELTPKDRDALAKALGSVNRNDLLSPRLRRSFAESRDLMLTRSGSEVVARIADDEIPGLTIIAIDVAQAAGDPSLMNVEMFGPASVIVVGAQSSDLEDLASSLDGQLTTSIFAQPEDDIEELIHILELRAGRILFDEWPTGVSVTYAQQHGGPYPASTASSSTSVGTAAIRRFVRPVAYQSAPPSVLPDEIKDENPHGIAQRVNGVWRGRSERTP